MTLGTVIANGAPSAAPLEPQRNTGAETITLALELDLHIRVGHVGGQEQFIAIMPVPWRPGVYLMAHGSTRDEAIERFKQMISVPDGEWPRIPGACGYRDGHGNHAT